MKKIWVTGSRGQLGTELFLQHKKLPDCNFLFTDIEELDLSRKELVLEFAQREKPDILINCAAYNAVDKAEQEQATAFILNRDVPAYLTEAIASTGAVLIHLSTDYVFDGTAETPYVETDIPNPQSVYAKSKLAGEHEVLKSNRNIIIRTSWLYSAYGNNFVKTMLRLGKERDEINVVADQFGTPTRAKDLANAILQIIRKLNTSTENFGGIYHYSNEGICSWYDFAIEIMKFAQFNCKIIPQSYMQYPSLAKRPVYSVLSKEKIKNTFNIDISEWRNSLVEHMAES